MSSYGICINCDERFFIENNTNDIPVENYLCDDCFENKEIRDDNRRKFPLPKPHYTKDGKKKKPLKKVSMISQVAIGLLIPIVSFYRIRRTWDGLAMVILFSFITATPLIVGAALGSYYQNDQLIDITFGILGVWVFTAPTLIPLYFIIKYTKEHNRKVELLT